MTPRLSACILVALLAGACFLSCRTSKNDEAKGEPILVTEFFPATYLAPVQLESGSYANLFAPDSYAVWLGSDVARLRREKSVASGQKIDPKLDEAVARINDNYLVFECHLASVFPDMSIGYDAVGLRGVNVYLVSPGGKKISPMQVIVGSSATEEPRQALRRFARTNLIIFQKKDLWTDKASINMLAPSARLMLEGFGSTFRFEWATALLPSEPWIPKSEEYIKAVKAGFRETYQRLVESLHTFD
jgi:hypothetical protein